MPKHPYLKALMPFLFKKSSLVQRHILLSFVFPFSYTSVGCNFKYTKPLQLAILPLGTASILIRGSTGIEPISHLGSFKVRNLRTALQLS